MGYNAEAGNGEDFSASSIEDIIPYNLGGDADPVGLAYANRLSEELGVDVNIINRPAGLHAPRPP